MKSVRVIQNSICIGENKQYLYVGEINFLILSISNSIYKMAISKEGCHLQWEHKSAQKNRPETGGVMQLMHSPRSILVPNMVIPGCITTDKLI